MLDKTARRLASSTKTMTENTREHTRELNSAYEFQDLAEHITWELGEAVDPVDYPLEVTVTIEAAEQQENISE